MGSCESRRLLVSTSCAVVSEARVGCLENDDLENDLENDDLENDDLENDDLENDDLENDDLENDDLENNDLENDDLENDDLENDDLKKNPAGRGGLIEVCEMPPSPDKTKIAFSTTVKFRK